jgi:branched-chain amino acid transport system ATP-binding protein
MSVALEVTGLHAYYGQSHVLQGVDLRVESGHAVALVGRNGAGKTTTLAAISGLLRPRRGAVRIGGADLAGAPAHRIAAAGVALVPQGRRIFGDLTVRENLVMAARPTSGGWEERSVLDLFPSLAARLRARGDELSGGEQQMLAIGRALMNRPVLLLLDEPSLGLSPILVKEIFEIIRRVNEEQGMSILLVEQNAKVALETAHYGYVLEIGRVVMNDTCDRLMRSQDIQEFYLGAKEAGARGERRWKKKKTWR